MLVLAVNGLSVRDAVVSTDMINIQRKKMGISKITYNYTIQTEMEKIPDNFWFNKSMNMSESFYLGTSLRNRPYNMYFTQFADFKYLFHDTVKTTMSTIINHRIKQHTCFKIKKCKPVFNYFYSCGYKQTDVQDNTKCSHAYHYYPRMLIKSLKQISCVLPPIQGPDVPQQLINVQKKVFICFGKYGNLLSDNPLEN